MRYLLDHLDDRIDLRELADHVCMSRFHFHRGEYAVGTHVGPYDGLPNAWNELCGKWLPTSGRTFANAPSFEVYLNDCNTTPPADLRTELYVPLAPAS